MKEKGKLTSGITLIALVVTIVVLLILTGITISLVFSDNGIIEKAREAANKTNQAVINEQVQMNELSDYMENMLNEIGRENNQEETTGPNGKPLVETLTEIQINNNVEAEDKYGNQITVPKGFKVVISEATTVPEGIVIEDANENQFVWIPVGTVHKDNNPANDVTIQLGRYTFDTTTGEPIEPLQYAYTTESATNYTNEVLIDTFYKELDESREGIVDDSNHLNNLNATAKNLARFIESVKANDGYYVARFEASYGSGNSIEDWMPLSKVSTGTPRGDDEGNNSLMQGRLWNWVTQIEASKISKNMYKNNNSVGVESDLVNSYAWDTAIIFIQEMGNTNYANEDRDETGNSSLMNTGTTGDKVCNIFDMAANLVEWTTEYSTYIFNNTLYNCTHRGCVYTASVHSTAGRSWDHVLNANQEIGFRVLLYIK